MSKLESLKINECPAALAQFAAKHNRLVDLIANTEGAVVSENNIVITAAAGASNNELHFNNGTISIDIDGNGIVMTNLSNGRNSSLIPGELQVNSAVSGTTIDRNQIYTGSAEVSNSLDVGGNITADDITLSGDVTATGTVQGATGTFTTTNAGTLSASSGTFTGGLSADNITLTTSVTTASLIIAGAAVSRLNSVQTCSPSATSNFLIIA